jgi:nitroreductase
MKHPHKEADTRYPIHDVLAQRWSPYAFADRPVSDADLQSIFEAARWAASSYNEQPWRWIVATKANPAEYARVLSCLVESNQAWAKHVPVLGLGVASLNFERNGKENPAAIHDLGIAAANIMHEATVRGLRAHFMIGILPERVRELYGVPDGFMPLTGFAMGYPGDIETLPEALRQRDEAKRTRKPLAETVFTGAWGKPAAL